MSVRELYIIYLAASVFFILAIRGLASPQTAEAGNRFGILGMGLAVFATLIVLPLGNDIGILVSGGLSALIGIWWGLKVQMTKLPQMVALLNGAGGLSSALIGVAQMVRGEQYMMASVFGTVIGTIAFSGSVIAFFKLNGKLNFRHFHLSYVLIFLSLLFLIGTWIEFSFKTDLYIGFELLLSAFVFGIMATIFIGGADMPIVISFLNAFSGLATTGIGFSMSNVALIITGALVGASGIILSLIMARATNRSLSQVFFKSFEKNEKNVSALGQIRQGSPQDAAFLMENANRVIIVPGYGMAAAGAQYALKNMALILKEKYHVDVKFAIHPVAGRMPGHMNVLLAEAKVDYEEVFSLVDINPEFETADVAYVIGANDITNPSAQTDQNSPLYGMPILEVSKAKTVFFVKRSLNPGYSGADNPLFYKENTLMLYGDAKKMTEEIIAAF